MIKRINQYLLTHNPLLWNTRVLWIIAINIILHCFFFITGLLSITTKHIIDYSSVWSVGGPGLYTFSVLCSLLVIIIWLIYFLRNNAFKNFYRIGKWYLVKEFLIILAILFSTITYFESFNYGVKLKVRSITNVHTFANEVNIVNHAMAYIPTDRMPYFILNDCNERIKNNRGYYDEIITDTVTPNFNDPINIIVKQALRRPDAFSYKNYCKLFSFRFPYPAIDSARKISSTKNEWLDRHRSDSVRNLLRAFVAICKKYDIDQKLDIDALTAAVFATPLYNISIVIPTTEFYRDNFGRTQRNRYFIQTFSITSVFYFLYECLPNRRSFEDQRNAFMIEGYVALCISILVLCYRRFNKKVFLISIVGTIVWSIVLGLFMAVTRGSETSVAIFCLILCLVFGLVAWINLKNNSLKTVAGTLLNWHIYLAPFFTMFLLLIVNEYYQQVMNRFYRINNQNAEVLMQNYYPLLYWIHSHNTEIVLANLFVIIFYVAILFNRWARRWHVMPEE